MKQKLLFCVSLRLFFTPFLAQAEDLNSIVLAIGEQKSFPAEVGARFSVGNPEVIQVKSTQMGTGKPIFIVKGKAAGYSDLVILGDDATNKSLAFRVVSKRQRALSQDGEKLFNAPKGVAILTQGNSWLLKGEAQNVEDFNVARAMGSPEKVKNLVRIHPLVRLKAESEIKRRLRQVQLDSIEVIGVGGQILLKGDLGSKADKEFAEDIAREVFANIRSHLRVPYEAAGQLRFSAKILELNRNSSQELGFDWSKEIPAALQLSTKFTKAALGLDATLRLLERRGQAKLLSKPNLLLNEKGVAELKVGGEIPIPSHTKNSSSVQWKPYGLSLKLEMPGISKKMARAKITVEIAGLDPTSGREGIPGIRSSKLETEVDIQIGRPVLLSGLIETRRSESVSQLPLLGDIPVLGELFRSHEFQENKSELVILLEANT